MCVSECRCEGMMQANPRYCISHLHIRENTYLILNPMRDKDKSVNKFENKAQLLCSSSKTQIFCRAPKYSRGKSMYFFVKTKTKKQSEGCWNLNLYRGGTLTLAIKLQNQAFVFWIGHFKTGINKQLVKIMLLCSSTLAI